MTTEMTRYKILGKLPKIRNKYVKAVLVTKDNKEELEKRYPAVALLDKSAQAYIVLKNPKQTVDKQEFMFVTKEQFEMNAKETYKNTNMPIFKNVSREKGDKLEAKYGAIVIDNTEKLLAKDKKKYVVFIDTRCPGKVFMEGYEFYRHNKVNFYMTQLITEDKKYAIEKVHELEEKYLAMNKTKITIAEVEEVIGNIKKLENKLVDVRNVLDEVMSNIDEPSRSYAGKTLIRTTGNSCYVDSNMLKDAVVNEASNLENEIANLKEIIGVE